MIIRTALMLYLFANCSYRSVAKALEVFNAVWMPIMPEGKQIDHTTIHMWVHKAGLDVLKNKPKTCKDAYALVLDASMSIGNQQLMVALAVPATPNGNAIKQEDAVIIDMEARSSWTSDETLGFTEKAIQKMGYKPQYTISDEGHNVKKALSMLGLPHHVDISHRFATVLKHAFTNPSFENDDFQQFNAAYGRTRRLAMTDCAYLMPVAIRNKGRFMNMFGMMDWATSMLENWHKLKAKEQYHYQFVNQYGALVYEMDEITQCYRDIMQLCKNQGLSAETTAKSMHLCHHLSYGTPRQRSIYEGIRAYFDRELSLLTDKQPTCHISSDIIESLFGFLKSRLSHNHFDGITATSLLLPLRPEMSNLDNASNFNVKERFERTKVKDVKTWKKQNLPGGQTSLRRNTLQIW